MEYTEMIIKGSDIGKL